MKKIVLFGLSANPPTMGHVLILQYISSIADFDEILVIPVYEHAVKDNLIEFHHRLEMCKLAFNNINKVSIDPIESFLSTPNYTFQTLNKLIETRPAEYSLVLGSDNLKSESGWGENLEKALNLVKPYYIERTLLFNTSSTEIREFIKNGNDFELFQVCPASVIKYIKENKLYMEKKIINSFSGEFEFLSNFYSILQISSLDSYNSVSNSHRLKTLEHGFQAAKTLDLIDQLSVLDAKTPGNAKRLGRKVKLRKDWESVKLNIMRQLVLDKFSQNYDLKDKLIATNDIELIEGNTWGDKFWGTVDGVGQNWLGKILMETREKLKGT